MNEEWKTIPGYDNYEASSLGRIRSLDYEEEIANRWGSTTIRRHTGRVLKSWINKKGYNYVSLGAKNKKEAHYWIAMTFLGPRKDAMEVNHKNGNKSDNSVENLEWVTRSQNSRHAFDTGLNHVGSKHGISKLDEAQVAQIKTILLTKVKRNVRPYYKEIAIMFGVDRKTIESIARGHTWRQI